jgi:hypothetical protein
MANSAHAITIKSPATDINMEIGRLEIELKRKTSELESCADKTKDFQIAGVAALGLTAAGVAVNVSQYNKRKSQAYQNNAILAKGAAGLEENNRVLEDIDDIGERFGAALEKMKSLDKDKLDKLIDENFTNSEWERVGEITGLLKSDPERFKHLSESDKELFLRFMNVMYKSSL